MAVEFHQYYKDRVIPALKQKHGYKNVNQVPKVDKVVVNSCVNASTDVKQGLEDTKNELALITGQKPSETRSKKEHREFQAPPAPGDRREGHAPRRPHV
jgi:large subunit ribosomal protein L5